MHIDSTYKHRGSDDYFGMSPPLYLSQNNFYLYRPNICVEQHLYFPVTHTTILRRALETLLFNLMQSLLQRISAHTIIHRFALRINEIDIFNSRCHIRQAQLHCPPIFPTQPCHLFLIHSSLMKTPIYPYSYPRT